MTPELQQLVTANHRQHAGHRPNPEHLDFVSAFKANHELVNEAHRELSRTNTVLAARRMCHETSMLNAALKRMLEAFAASEMKRTI